MVLLCGVTVMFLAGLPWWIFAAPAVAVAVAAPIVYSCCTVISASASMSSSTRRATRSAPATTSPSRKIAIGSGGILGKGFLNGTQSHLDYLPEGHTDFVFATMAEEWGLVGGIFLICAFAVVIRWGMRVASAPEPASPSWPLRACRRRSSSTSRST